jgi:hypothetical protein
VRIASRSAEYEACAFGGLEQNLLELFADVTVEWAPLEPRADVEVDVLARINHGRGGTMTDKALTVGWKPVLEL